MAEVITSGKVIQKPDIVLEVDDFLPPGLIGVRTKTVDEGRTEDIGQEREGVGTLDPAEQDEQSPVTNTAGEYYEIMPVPADFRIVSQNIRIGPDQKMIVDVEIESTDFPGITEFEARIVLDGPAS